MKWELTYLALSAVDTAQTVRCLKRQMCTEGNPLFGRNPKAGTLILAKAGGGLAHFLLFKSIMRRNPTVAKRVAQVSVGLQSGIVLWNARLGL